MRCSCSRRPSRPPPRLDKEKVREALEKIKGFVGTAGIFNMSATDHNGLDINAFEMLTVKGGKFADLQRQIAFD